MPGELGLVVGDALDADDPLPGLEVQHLVDQRERVSVREHLEDVLGHGEDSLGVRDTLADVSCGGSCSLLTLSRSFLCHLESGNRAAAAAGAGGGAPTNCCSHVHGCHEGRRFRQQRAQGGHYPQA